MPALARATAQRRTASGVAAGRVVLAAAVALATGLWPGASPHADWVTVAAAAGWLPVAVACFVASERGSPRWFRYAGFLADCAFFGALNWLLPNNGAAIAPLGFLAAEVAGLATLPELPPAIPAASVILAGAISRSTALTSAETWLRLVTLVLVAMAIAALWRRMTAAERAAVATSEFLLHRTRSIVDHVAHPIVLTDGSARIESWNQAARDTFPQVTEGGRCAGLGLHLGERPLDCDNRCGLLSLCADVSADRAEGEVWRARADGNRQPFLASAVIVRAADGSVHEVVHSFNDISRLKEADEAKTLFLATASHELRTPLTVITGFSDMLLNRQNLPEELQEQALRAIRTRADELTQVVDRLLLSSRIEAGRLEVETRPVDLGAIVTERACVLATSRERRIDVAVDDNLPAAKADPTALATVVDHLVENAVKYSPPAALIDVVASADAAAVHVAVRDRGVGMSPDQVRRCFERFWQADNTERRGYGGTGIGLYVVKSLVESMGGEVAVESAVGRGSTFTVTLPRVDVTDGVSDPAASPDAAGSSGQSAAPRSSGR